MHAEAKEIFEGAKNFAKNVVRLTGDNGSPEVDPKMINENFDEAYGWTEMRYELQLYDIDIGRLEEISGKTTFDQDGAAHKKSGKETIFYDEDNTRLVKDEDGMPRELIYVQDLLTVTKEVNENTLLAELKIYIKLFEQNYVDNSVSIEFKTLFGSKLDEDVISIAESQP